MDMDIRTLAAFVVTLVLFVAALFFKGLTHDLFLEAGVFLVSMKIILMSVANAASVKLIHEKLDAILTALKEGGKSET
jgi:hypothetical protein